ATTASAGNKNLRPELRLAGPGKPAFRDAAKYVDGTVTPRTRAAHEYVQSYMQEARRVAPGAHLDALDSKQDLRFDATTPEARARLAQAFFKATRYAAMTEMRIAKGAARMGNHILAAQTYRHAEGNLRDAVADADKEVAALTREKA